MDTSSKLLKTPELGLERWMNRCYNSCDTSPVARLQVSDSYDTVSVRTHTPSKTSNALLPVHQIMRVQCVQMDCHRIVRTVLEGGTQCI